MESRWTPAGRSTFVIKKNNRIRKPSALGVGQLAVTWSAPGAAGGSITSYNASASAAGHQAQTCTTTGVTSCTLTGLDSGVVYSVAVTATNAAGTSAPSAPTTATPNG